MARRFHRIRHHASRAGAGWKGSAMSVGAGAATGIASNYAVGAVPFLGQAWWTMPTAMAVVGHFLKRKYPSVGGAMLGIAGYWAYNTYMQQKSGAATAKGLEGGDAGALLNYNQTIGTSAAPALETAQAAALVGPGGTMSTMGFVDAGYASAGDIVDAYGLET
jgi:hypothetical protein